MQDLERSLLFAAIDRAHFGICILDDAGRILVLSPAFAEKLAIKTDISLGRHFSTVVSAIPKSVLGRLCDIGQPEERIEAPAATLGGPKRLLLLQSSNMRHANESFRMVSALEIADYGLSQDRFKFLQRQMESASKAIVLVDAKSPELPIVHINKQFQLVTGYGPEEAIGRNCRFLQNGTSGNESELRVLRSAISAKQSCSVRMNNARKDGSLFINELFISPVFDAEDEVSYYVGVVHCVG